MMNNIYALRDGIVSLFTTTVGIARRFVKSDAAPLAFAITTLGAVLYWFVRSSDTNPLKGRVTLPLETTVTELEKEFKSFWSTVGTSAIEFPQAQPTQAWRQKAETELAELNAKVAKLPESTDQNLGLRIKALREKAYINGVQLEDSKSPTSSEQENLERLDWEGIIDSYEKIAQAAKNDKSDIRFTKECIHYRELLLDQLKEINEKASSQKLLGYLERMHQAGRLSISLETVVEVPLNGSLGTYGGLQRDDNNSCYLASVLQFFRAFDTLKARFNPHINSLTREEHREIQTTIFNMLERMDQGETIGAEEGKNLQRLLKAANILDEDVFGMYDVQDIALRLLEIVNSTLPWGQYSTQVFDSNGEFLRENLADYGVIIPASEEWIDVGSAIHTLATAPQDEIIGENRYVKKVTALPAFMSVTFQGAHPQLYNMSEFDDPFDRNYKYELRFAVENVGAHWIAHTLCQGIWQTANDARITRMNQDVLGNINHGYYVRVPKDLITF